MHSKNEEEEEEEQEISEEAQEGDSSCLVNSVWGVAFQSMCFLFQSRHLPNQTVFSSHRIPQTNQWHLQRTTPSVELSQRLCVC